MTTHQVRILSTTVAVPVHQAYEFAYKPENFPKWAAGLSSSLHQTDAGWLADTPLGQATIRFTDRNDFGVLDHWVTVEGSPEVYIPLRLIANGEGAELELVLYRQPEMSDADFERDIALVGRTSPPSRRCSRTNCSDALERKMHAVRPHARQKASA